MFPLVGNGGVARLIIVLVLVKVSVISNEVVLCRKLVVCASERKVECTGCAINPQIAMTRTGMTGVQPPRHTPCLSGPGLVNSTADMSRCFRLIHSILPDRF